MIPLNINLRVSNRHTVLLWNKFLRIFEDSFDSEKFKRIEGITAKIIAKTFKIVVDSFLIIGNIKRPLSQSSVSNKQKNVISTG